MNVDIVLEEDGREWTRVSVPLEPAGKIGSRAAELLAEYRASKADKLRFNRLVVRLLREPKIPTV